MIWLELGTYFYYYCKMSTTVYFFNSSEEEKNDVCYHIAHNKSREEKNVIQPCVYHIFCVYLLI